MYFNIFHFVLRLLYRPCFVSRPLQSDTFKYFSMTKRLFKNQLFLGKFVSVLVLPSFFFLLLMVNQDRYGPVIVHELLISKEG